MKKLYILSLLILVISLVLTVPAFASYTDVVQGAIYENSVNNLTNMGIIEGKEDSTFKPDESITRAQFMKVIVMALGKGDEALAKNYATIFSDVNKDYWANGYINVAVENNIISGYSDGTFKPDQEVPFSQAITIILRTLGYSSSDISGVWPQNYIEKGKSLHITDGLTYNASDIVSRGNLALMLDRAIGTQMKGQTKTLAEQSGFGTIKTCIITNSWDVDGTLPTGLIKTDVGDFTSKVFSGLNLIGCKVNALIDDDNNFLSAVSIAKSSQVVFVTGIAGNQVYYNTDKGSGSIGIPDNVVFYYKGQKTTFKEIKQSVMPGSIIGVSSIAASSNSYDYGALVDQNTINPIVVKKNVDAQDKEVGNINIANKKNYIVMKNDEKASFSDILEQDVLYFIKNPFKTNSGVLAAYDTKVTGTYDQAYPSKNTVSKIKILNQELSIETAAAGDKLNESEGAFNLGDRITVLLGATGKIVDVIKPGSADLSNISIVVNTSKTTVASQVGARDKILYYAKLYKMDGTTTQYQTAEDATNTKGRIVTYDIKDDLATITPIDNLKITGAVDKESKIIGDIWLSEDVIILDELNNLDSNDILISQIDIKDLPNEITDSIAVHAQRGGAFNDVQLLVVSIPAITVSNVSTTKAYGMLLSRPTRYSNDGTVVGKYKFLIDGKQVQYQNESKIFGVESQDIVYIEFEFGQLARVLALDPKDSAKKVQAIDSRRIKINDKIYRLSKDVQVYDVTTSTPSQLTMDDVVAGEYTNVNIFAGTNDLDKNQIIAITITK